MSDDNHYSDVEIEDILSHLDELSRVRLTRTLAQLGPERIGWGPEDLLQHTFADLINGQRTWPRDVQPRTFIRNAARSILDNQLGKRKHELSALHVTDEGADVSESELQQDGMSSVNEGANRDQRLTQSVEAVTALFVTGGDADVLCLIKQMLENANKKTILIACELTESMYNAARAKLKYRARKAFPSGLKFWEISS